MNNMTRLVFQKSTIIAGLILVGIMVQSCKPDTVTSSTDEPTAISEKTEMPTESSTPATTPSSDQSQTTKPEATAQTSSYDKKWDALPLQDPCSLISDQYLAELMKIDVQSINVKLGSSPSQTAAQSCFFRWDHDGVPNSGVLVQVQKNPLPDEIDDWATYYIQAKLHGGDKDPQSGEAFKYKKFEGVGKAGAYSHQMHRYLWRTDKNRVFLLAFNLDVTAEEELRLAKEISQEVMKNHNL